MARQKGDYIEGRDLMVFVDTSVGSGEPTWTKTAAATSHTISYSAETKERVTKDTGNGAFSQKSVTKLSVSISVEALTTYQADCGFKSLLKMFKERKPVKLKYGFTTDEGMEEHEEGLFVITSLEESSPADDDATYSATFENTGNVETKTGGS